MMIQLSSTRKNKDLQIKNCLKWMRKKVGILRRYILIKIKGFILILEIQMNHPSEEIIKEWQKQKEKLRLEKLESQTDGIFDCCKVESALIITDEYQGICKLLHNINLYFVRGGLFCMILNLLL